MPEHRTTEELRMEVASRAAAATGVDKQEVLRELSPVALGEDGRWSLDFNGASLQLADAVRKASAAVRAETPRGDA